jgi:hypothetical protein
LEHPGIVGRIILRCIFRMCDGGAWTGFMSPASDRWQALVSVVLNLRFP